MITATLLAVDLPAATHAYQRESLAALARRHPRGRVAALLAGPVGGEQIDPTRPAAEALARISLAARRDVFDAVVEDLAIAAVFDAPLPGLEAAFAALAEREPDLTFARLCAEGAPGYPVELLDDPNVESADPGGDLAILVSGPLVTSALGAIEGALKRRPSDVLEALWPLLVVAERPGHVIVKLGEKTQV